MLNHKNTSIYSKINKSILLGLTLFLVNFSSYAEFTQFDASYTARFDKFKAKSKMSLRQNTETGLYTYTTYTKPKGIAKIFGSIKESLTFNLNQNSVIPKKYSHNSRSDNINIDYDWLAKKVSSKTEDGSEELELKGTELDLLSLQMQLTRDLKNKSLKPTYSVIKDNAVKIYTVTELGEDTFKLGDDTYKTIKIQQQRKGSSRRSVLQFAPDLNFILVKMQQFKGDKQRASFNLYAYKNLGVVKVKNIATEHLEPKPVTLPEAKQIMPAAEDR